MLNTRQSALLADRTAGLDLEELIRCVKACGFDPERYVEIHPDLQNTDFDRQQGMLHFLAIGYQQRCELTCGSFPDGLDGIRRLAPRDRDYVTRLFRNLFFGQVRQVATADRLWNGIDRNVIDCIRDMGGQPYFVIGDSHANHYLRRTSAGEKWLAALPMVCAGAAAMQLALEDSPSGFGPRILGWARRTAALAAELEVPTFLKFGGIDAEFHWVQLRIGRAAYRFSIDQFNDFAREAVSCYGRFLDLLAGVMDRRLLRICTAYPAATHDAYWADNYFSMQRISDRAFIGGELAKMEIPDRSVRTQLRRVFNQHLEEMCRAKSLALIDDFSPFVDPNGETDEICYASHQGRGFHISYAASEERMVNLIAAAIASEAASPHPLPSVRQA